MLFKISEIKLTNIFSTLWLIYFVCSVVLSVYDLTTVKRVDWEGAQNVSKMRNGYKASIITSSFQKNNKKVSRKYGALFEGINVYLWGVNKRADTLNISFYVKAKDFDEIINESKKEGFPFFGLRNFGKTANTIFLFLDIWKFNYLKVLGLIIIGIPFLITYMVKNVKFLAKNIVIQEVEETKGIMTKISILFFVIFILNMLI